MALAKHDKAEKKCDVSGCDKEAERSISLNKVSKTSLKLKDPNVRSAHLCKEHYKEFKKETKKDRDLDKVY